MVIAIDQPSLLDTVLQYGLFLGAMFQLVCVFAVVLIPETEKEKNAEDESARISPVQLTTKQHSDHTGSRKGKKEKKKHR